MPIWQVRDVPEDLDAAVKRRAREEGVSLSELIRVQMARSVAVPSRSAWQQRLASRKPVTDIDAAESVRAAKALDR